MNPLRFLNLSIPRVVLVVTAWPFVLFGASADPDESVPMVTGLIGTLSDVLPFEDGSYLMSGYFSQLATPTQQPLVSRRNLAKMNPDGSVDTSLDLPQTNGEIGVMALAPNGKIYLGGWFGQLGTAGSNGKLAWTAGYGGIFRLNADLTLDTSFQAAAQNKVHAILPLADGRVLIAGEFHNVNSVSGTEKIALLHADGSVDTSFVSQQSNQSSTVLDLAHAPNGTFWIRTTKYGGGGLAPERQHVIRITATGAVAPGYQYSGTLAGNENGYFAVQSDGSILSTAHGLDWGKIERIQPNGSPDYSVWANATGTGPMETGRRVTAIASYPDGRTVMAGQFTEFPDGGVARNGIVATHADGRVISEFDPLDGLTGGPTKKIRIDQQGRLWIVGNATYRGATINGLVVLNGLGAGIPSTNDPYDDFVAALPEGQRGINDDPDGDGVPNLVEFALGRDPASIDPHPVAASQVLPGSAIPGAPDANKHYRVVEIVVPKDTHGVNVGLAATTDLTFADGASATEILPRTDRGDSELRRYLLTPAVEDTTRLFWSITATR